MSFHGKRCFRGWTSCQAAKCNPKINPRSNFLVLSGIIIPRSPSPIASYSTMWLSPDGIAMNSYSWQVVLLAFQGWPLDSSSSLHNRTISGSWSPHQSHRWAEHAQQWHLHQFAFVYQTTQHWYQSLLSQSNVVLGFVFVNTRRRGMVFSRLRIPEA